MFPYPSVPEEPGVQSFTDEDQQLLFGLIHKYGVSNLLCAMNPYGQPSRASILSASTILSSSASSMGWTNSEVASQCRSDRASVHTSYTFPDVGSDVATMTDADIAKSTDQTWLDSPATGAISSPQLIPYPAHDVTTGLSVNSGSPPRLITPTTKKYQCPMCFLDGSPVGFGRKSDFKKHLHNFHGADTVWICRTKGCHLSFSTERAYSTHAKDAHRMKALPNSAARTEMCPQLVFSCGFSGCRDRVFEAHSVDDASTTRDKHFEHIAKHFEDGFDVNDWEYRIQVQNLMRQKQVKSVWKTCIWPKEKRQTLHWKPRSSGDLKRILECRHLGNNIQSLVRLAFILGTAPFTTSSTPPPSEVDVYFQLPYKSQCLLGPAGHAASGATHKGGDEAGASPAPSSFSVAKNRSQAMLKLAARQMKRSARPPTAASIASGNGDIIMGEPDVAAGPHPGTPFPIPSEAVWPVDAPKLHPEAPTSLSKQMHTPLHTPINITLNQQQQQQQQHQQQQHQQQQQMMYAMPEQDPTSQPWLAAATMDAQSMAHFGGQPQPHDPHQQMMVNVYDYAMSINSDTNTRPATPTASSMASSTKRPMSWNRFVTMEALRPSKKPMPSEGPFLGDLQSGMLMGL